MRKSFLLLVVGAILLSSFTVMEEPHLPGLPFCTALKKVLKEAPSGFSSLKGKLISMNDDGSQNFQLRLNFDGWSSNQFVQEEDGAYVELSGELTTKEKAISQYNKALKQLQTCLGSKGETLKAEKLDRLQIFKKEEAEIGLMVVTEDQQSLVVLTIEKADED